MWCYLLQTTEGGQGKQSPSLQAPIIEPENTGVRVVDVVDEPGESANVAFTLLFLETLLLLGGVAAILWHKKKIRG
jgi:hypothetical protein